MKSVNAPNFQQRYADMQKEIISNELVQQFIAENRDVISQQMIERSFGKLYEFISASHHCDKCPSLEGCINIMKGFEPKLVIKGDFIEVDYMKCPSMLKEDDRREISSMIESMYMPKDVMEARLHDVDFEGNSHESRLTVMERMKAFLTEYDETGKLPRRGLYIHGPFGVGKSYIAGALANELAERRVKTVIVYVPEFLREIKQAIQDQTLNEKIDFVKTAEVLILDDFGAESMTNWTRDEVIGAILQFRMAEQLPTFFTSNLGFKELEQHLAFTQRGEKDVVKAARIMERMNAVTEEVMLYGENRRH